MGGRPFSSSSRYKSSQYFFPPVCDLCSFSQIFAVRWLDTLQMWLKLSSHWFDYLEELPRISFWVRYFQFHAHAFQLPRRSPLCLCPIRDSALLQRGHFCTARKWLEPFPYQLNPLKINIPTVWAHQCAVSFPLKPWNSFWFRGPTLC